MKNAWSSSPSIVSGSSDVAYLSKTAPSFFTSAFDDELELDDAPYFVLFV